VQLYGAIDAGLVYVNNVQGKSLTKVDGGGNWASRWGVRGREDLGGGMASLFVLEAGFNPDDGTAGQGGLAFGRQSFVGLSHAKLGTLTLGRQYDFVYAIPPDVVMIVGGLAGATGGGGVPADLHLGGVRYDNSVKYTNGFGPMQLGLMHGQGRENGDDKMTSAYAAYRSGPVNAGIAYVTDNFTPVVPSVQGNRVLVGSVHYYLSKTLTLTALAGRSKADMPADRVSSNRLVNMGVLWQASPGFHLGLALAQSRMNNAAGAKGTIRQIGVGAYYDLSRRTTLYGIVSQVNSSGAAGKAYSSVPGIGGNPGTFRSSDNQQSVLKLGIRHFF
jgi:predicted porin